MNEETSNYKTADVKLERNSDTFKQFEALRIRLGYTNFKAGLVAAMNFMLQHYNNGTKQLNNSESAQPSGTAELINPSTG